MANIINPTLFLISKIVSGSTTVVANYTDSNNPSNQYNGYPFQFEVQINLNIQYHSDPNTKTPLQYDAYSVKINDWIGQSSGKAYRIAQIVNVIDQENLNVVLEDEDLYNLSFDPTQQGNNYPDEEQYGGIFQLGYDGLPILTGLTPNNAQFSISSYWVSDIEGRFRYKSFLGSYLTMDKSVLSWSSIQIGDFVYMDENGLFVKVDNDNYETAIYKAFGIITTIDDVDPSKILVRPFGKITTNLPTMPGVPGDVLYFDSNGPSNLSTVKATANSFPVYIKMDETTALALTNHPSSNLQIEVLPVETDVDLDQTTTPTNGNYSQTGITIEYTPFMDSNVIVTVNGIGVNLGNGIRTKDCYFSNDGGTTARRIKDISGGDELFWNGGFAGYDLDSTDNIDFEYDVADTDAANSQ
jgi:hypothetical protein